MDADAELMVILTVSGFKRGKKFFKTKVVNHQTVRISEIHKILNIRGRGEVETLILLYVALSK